MTDFGLSDDALVRLVAGLVLGAAVGIERETADQQAGLRTHIAVCLGAALFGVISTLGFDEYAQRRAETNYQVDVTRVASQVVVGISFLGAGLIFRQGGAVRNLTTSASLWTVAAVGLACGVGDIGVAATATALTIGALALLRPIRSLLRRRFSRDVCRVELELEDGAGSDELMGDVRTRAGEADIDVESMKLSKRDGRYVVYVHFIAPPGHSVDGVVNRLARRDDVRTLTVQ